MFNIGIDEIKFANVVESEEKAARGVACIRIYNVAKRTNYWSEIINFIAKSGMLRQIFEK